MREKKEERGEITGQYKLKGQSSRTMEGNDGD